MCHQVQKLKFLRMLELNQQYRFKKKYERMKRMLRISMSIIRYTPEPSSR